MPALKLPGTVLLDGDMGRELRFRGVDILDTIWSVILKRLNPSIGSRPNCWPGMWTCCQMAKKRRHDCGRVLRHAARAHCPAATIGGWTLTSWNPYNKLKLLIF